MDSLTATSAPPAREQTRARYPDREGFVERDGVRVFYEVYGDGEPTILLLPTWSIIHSRFWKAQIPYLARRFRVITFDGRGNGKSDRPPEPEAYAEPEFADDALAVMDATSTEQAVLVSLSRGAERSHAARRRPPRARRRHGVHRAGRCRCRRPRRGQAATEVFSERRDVHSGWEKWNRHYWLEHYEDFLEFFFGSGLHRAALHEAARGRDRLGAGDGPRDAGGDAARPAAPRRGRACARWRTASPARCW